MGNKNARSFVGIMLVIAVLSLFLRIAIEKIIKFNIVQNESNVESTLKLISAAFENYAKDHLGQYPANFYVLTSGKPSYLDRDYLSDSPIKGYDYNCQRLETLGYSCQAVPIKCGLSGKKSYYVTTGSVITYEDCSKKE